MELMVISSRFTSAVTSPEASNSSSGSSAITFDKRFLKASIFAVSTVTPTAPWWPPKRTVRSAHCSTAWNKSTEPTERPEPRATPSWMVNRMQGT